MNDKRLISYKFTYQEYIHLLDGLCLKLDKYPELRNKIEPLHDKLLKLSDSVK